MEVAVLALAGSATALATGLGAVPVFLLGPRAVRLRPFLWGTAVGLMGVASPAELEGIQSSLVRCRRLGTALTDYIQLSLSDSRREPLVHTFRHSA